VTTYVGGQAGTPVTTYSDSTGLVANPNPMTLNSAGRAASASGAPVAFWVPGGTLVQLLVADSLGNVLVFLDNVPAINDLTNTANSLQTLLASGLSANVSGSGPVGGADFVANAVKSYDIIADVRAANAPVLVTGQTLNIEVQGGTIIGDNLGGFFYWSPSSTATDDGRTVLKPTSVATASGGRWLRYYPLGVAQIIQKPTPQQVASSTGLVFDTALFAALLSGGTYLVQLRLQLLGIGGTAQGWKVGTTFLTGTLNGNGGGGGVVSGNGTAVVTASSVNATMSNAAVSSTATAPDVCNIDFVVSVSVAGVLQIQFAQNSSSANATQMNAGSALIVTRIS
jgi:hypothetical protein